MRFVAKLFALAVLAVSALYLVQPPSARADSLGWPQDRGDAQKTGSRFVDELPRGQVVWRFEFGSHLPNVDASPAVAPSSTAGAIYIGGSGNQSYSPSLVAINPDGTVKWSIRLQAGGFHYKVRTTPGVRTGDNKLTVVAYRKVGSGNSWSLKGRVFWVSLAGTVLRVSPEYDGVGLSAPLLWTDRDYVFSHPVYSDDRIRGFHTTTFAEFPVGDIHYGITGGSGCLLPCYDPSLHNLSYWMYSSHYDPDTKPLFPSPSKDGAEILQPSAQTARFGPWGQLWQRDVIGLTTSPTVGGNSFIGATSSFDAPAGRVEARNSTGGRLWAYSGSFPSGIAYSDSGNDHIYYTKTNGTIYSRFVTGDYRWGYQLSSAGRMGAPVVAKSAQGELVIASDSNGTLWAFDVYGQTKWAINLDSPALGSPAIADGRIYVATQQSLYAIR
jgi:hypothetical protein